MKIDWLKKFFKWLFRKREGKTVLKGYQPNEDPSDKPPKGETLI